MRRVNQGFTTIEITMATFMIAAAIVSAYVWWNNALKEFMKGVGTVNNSEQAHRSLRAMTDVIREARDGEDGAYPLSMADDQELVIYSDVTSDQRTDRVRYFLEGEFLKRGVIEPEGDPAVYPLENEKIRLVATGVANGAAPIFYFYDANWPGDRVNNPLAVGDRLLKTRYIEIKIEIDQDGEQGGQLVQLQAGSQLRNLKDDY